MINATRFVVPTQQVNAISTFIFKTVDQIFFENADLGAVSGDCTAVCFYCHLAT